MNYATQQKQNIFTYKLLITCHTLCHTLQHYYQNYPYMFCLFRVSTRSFKLLVNPSRSNVYICALQIRSIKFQISFKINIITTCTCIMYMTYLWHNASNWFALLNNVKLPTLKTFELVNMVYIYNSIIFKI